MIRYLKILQVPVLATVSCFCANFSFSQAIAPSPYSSDVKVNFIRVWDAQAPISRVDTLLTRPFIDVRQTTQYFDGLSRLFQTVVKKGSLDNTSGPAIDLVTPIIYDEFGRERYKYLSFPANNTGGNTAISDGLFKLNPFQQDSAFCKNQYTDESWFYNQTNYDPSPLNAILESFSPGNNWVGTSTQGTETNRHSTKMKYWFNTTTDSVLIWTVTDAANSFGTYAAGGIYAAGQLSKTVTVDEHNKQIIEFKDKEGRLILLKVQLTATADDGTGKNYSGWLCTYYIYDELYNVRCVVQPRGVELLSVNSWSMSALSGDILKEQCFRYEYDGRGRQIMKKVPGVGVTYMVYDARDRLVLSQDSLLRAAHKWVYTQYDEQNRPTSTGLIIDNTNYNNPSYHWSNAASSITWPVLGSYQAEELKKSFYDDYTWRSSEGNPLSNTKSTSHDSYLLTPSNSIWPYPQAISQSAQLKGLATGTKTKVLNSTNTYLYGVCFYDEKNRNIQTQNSNITGGTDITTSQYTFNGQTILHVIKNDKASTNAQTHTVITQNGFDSLWRIRTVHKTIVSYVDGQTKNGSQHLTTRNTYNKLGELSIKEADPSYNSNAGLTTSNFVYNICGWLISINKGFVSGSGNSNDFFGLELAYDKATSAVGTNSYTNQNYNGNISGTIWRSKGDGEARKYDFSYDAVNRLTAANFDQFTSGTFNKNAGLDFSVSGLSYDGNGNIGNLKQRGWKLAGSETIDSLQYTYVTNSNRLKNVLDHQNDVMTKLSDFRSSQAYMTTLSNSKTTSATDYSYDANGNLTVDNNKDIAAIRYNHLNLPDSIAVTGKGTIKYVYDAAGNKLKKITTEGAITTTTLYMFGNYINDTLQFLPHEEGRIRLTSNPTTPFVYDYFLKDQLGNIRMMLTEEQKTDAYPIASMEDVSDPADLEDPDNYIPYYGNSDYTENGDYRYAISNIANYISDYYTTPDDYVVRLNSQTSVIGPNMVLKVMAGDKINVRVSYFWEDTNPNYYIGDFNGLVDMAVAAMSGGLANLSNGKATSGGLSGELDDDVDALLQEQLYDFLEHDLSIPNPSKPAGFLTWIFFDEQFKLDESSSGFEQIGNPNSLDRIERTALPVNKNGYLYVYVSNSSAMNVFFDNFQVTHVRGPILEETHYYPFGLTMHGLSSNAINFGGDENKLKWNKASELQSKEFGDGNGLDWYATNFRSLDPQLGRWWQVDPKPNIRESLYASMSNNPISINDILGDTAVVFAKNGDFLRFEDDGKKKYTGKVITGSSSTLEVKDGKTVVKVKYKTTKFKFNDAKTDVQAIKNGVITRIEFASDELIKKQIERSGVYTKDAQKNPLSYALNQGPANGKMDYGIQGANAGDLSKNTLYIYQPFTMFGPSPDYKAYDIADFGNFLLGWGVAELGIAGAQLGGQYNHIRNGRKGGDYTKLYDFGPGTYGSPGMFDSRSDQNAIKDGGTSSPKGRRRALDWMGLK